VIAIVVDDFEQAVPYLTLAHPMEDRYVVVLRPEDVPGCLTGAAFLGGSPEARERVRLVLKACAHAVAGEPSG
jgi:hypothetical protein